MTATPQSQSAFPLSWPMAWKRAAYQKTSGFGLHSIDACTREILHQLKLLGVGDYNVVISTNIPLRNDGLPYSGWKQPKDTGVAVYFKLKGRACVLACDKWRKVEENLWALGKDIEAQRGRIRWGVGSVEQAFAGYTALPAPGDSGAATWWAVLGVGHDAPFDVTREAYRAQAKRCHPDANGGSHEAMTRLNAAWDMARKAYGQS